jgi:hypothetical protein
MNVPGYDKKEKFEFGVLTSFAYPIENSGEYHSHLYISWVEGVYCLTFFSVFHGLWND